LYSLPDNKLNLKDALG
jgi:hypothetical protein